MTLIALTGGIASGKSTVAKLFEELGAIRIDSDQVSREVVAKGQPALAQLEQAFGAEVLLESGELDRKKLGSIVFSDPEKLETLNQIVHPAVYQESRRQFAEAQKSGSIIIYEIPLLVESKNKYDFDRVITVESNPELQISRLIENRGYSLSEATARVNSQVDSKQRIELADYVIDSSKSLEDTATQVKTIWIELLDQQS